MSNNNWKMPEPVFQRTSGSLPPDFLSRRGVPQSQQHAPVSEAKSENDEMLSSLYAPPAEIPVTTQPPAADPAPAPAIEAQPIISEQFSLTEIDTTTPARVPVPKKRSGLSSIFIAVAIFIVLTIAVAGAALVYFLLLRQPTESTF